MSKRKHKETPQGDLTHNPSSNRPFDLDEHTEAESLLVTAANDKAKFTSAPVRVYHAFGPAALDTMPPVGTTFYLPPEGKGKGKNPDWFRHHFMASSAGKKLLDEIEANKPAEGAQSYEEQTIIKALQKRISDAAIVWKKARGIRAAQVACTQSGFRATVEQGNGLVKSYLPIFVVKVDAEGHQVEGERGQAFTVEQFIGVKPTPAMQFAKELRGKKPPKKGQGAGKAEQAVMDLPSVFRKLGKNAVIGTAERVATWLEGDEMENARSLQSDPNARATFLRIGLGVGVVLGLTGMTEMLEGEIGDDVKAERTNLPAVIEQ